MGKVAPGLLASVFLLSLSTVLLTPAAAFPERWEHDRAWAAPGGGDFLLADLTGDGITDLAAVDGETRAVRVYEGTGAGIPRDSTHSFDIGEVADLASRDVDGDGRLDLIAVGPSHATWLSWKGAGSKAAERHAFPLDGAPLAVMPGDFDSDGDTDLAILDRTSCRIWFQFEGGFLPSANLTLEDGPFDATVAGDVDGNGRQDILLARQHEVRVYLQQTSGLDLNPRRVSIPAFGDLSLALVETPRATGVPPYVAIAGPWDSPEGGGLGLWRWENGTLRPLSATLDPGARWITAGDVNDDARSDIVLSRADGSVHVFFQRGGAQITGIPDLVLEGVGANASVAIGDINGDRFEDVLLRTRNPDRFVAFLQEDAPPSLVQPIPSTYAVNRSASATGIIDLREYFADDHDVLSFQIAASSDDNLLTATVNGSTVSFTASADAYGASEFRVTAWDGNPSHEPVESNVFSVLVNEPPVVVSSPEVRAIVGETYAYVIRVADAFPREERHVYALLTRPEGMSIDGATGLVTWTPKESQTGAHHVRAEIRDDHGGWILHTFTVFVVPITGTVPLPLVVVGFLGTTAALAAAALVSENAKWAFLLIFLPLYSKIKRERVLDHFVRGQIFGYIQANPGEHYNAIKSALGLTNGSLAHHLRTLEREQFVKSRRFGLYRRFYPMQFRIPDQETFQPNEIQRTILNVIRQSPGITQKEIATRLGLTPPTVNYHVTLLSERKLIEVVRRGRSTHCSIVESPN